MKLERVLSQIVSPCPLRMEQAKNRVDQLIKPQGSMGKLEDMAVKLVGIYDADFPIIDKTTVIVMCADHGVCEEHVASAPQAVTLMQAINMTKGITGVGALCQSLNSELHVYDIGINAEANYPGIYQTKLMYGTKNMAKEAAMDRETAIKALEIGINAAISAVEKGSNALATGEMGIGNTTPSTAILSVLSGKTAKALTGIGANFPEHLVPHKAEVIQRAIDLNKPNANDPLDILSKVGGLDIAGMAGVMIGGAYKRVPVVIDGYISTISALIACALEPKVKDYLFSSHFSLEKGASLASDLLGLTPFLDLSMRLGEGSGAVLAFPFLKAACDVNRHMITFEEAGIGVV